MRYSPDLHLLETHEVPEPTSKWGRFLDLRPDMHLVYTALECGSHLHMEYVHPYIRATIDTGVGVGGTLTLALLALQRSLESGQPHELCTIVPDPFVGFLAEGWNVETHQHSNLLFSRSSRRLAPRVSKAKHATLTWSRTAVRFTKGTELDTSLLNLVTAEEQILEHLLLPCA